MKRLLILGMVQNCPENHHNVSKILSELKLDKLLFTVSADIKMCKFNFLENYFCNNFPNFIVLCLIGKSSSGKYGCPFCSSPSPYSVPGSLYTLEDIANLNRVLSNYVMF